MRSYVCSNGMFKDISLIGHLKTHNNKKYKNNNLISNHKIIHNIS